MSRESIPFWQSIANQERAKANKKGKDGKTDPYYLYCIGHIERIKLEKLKLKQK